MIKVTIPTLPEHLSVLLLEFDDKGYYTYPSRAPECSVTKSLMIKVTIPTLPEHLSVLLLEFDDKGYYTYPS
jgi:hypothetical protein